MMSFLDNLITVDNALGAVLLSEIFADNEKGMNKLKEKHIL